MSEQEYNPTYITVTDDDGIEHNFEELDRIETDEGEHFIALVPAYENSEDLLDDDGELIILKVVEKDDAFYLEPIEDEEKFDEIGAIFQERLNDMFEFDDEEE